MLNITGGGEQRIRDEFEVCQAEPSLVLDPDSDANLIIKEVEALF